MKRLANAFLAILMLFSMTAASYATEVEPDSMINLTDELILTLDDEGIQPQAWGGPAPQVTKIEPYKIGWLTDKPTHLGIILKVTGYGHDTAYFNGVEIDSEEIGYFINYGNTADGFYYLYDCGEITAVGTYRFTVTFTSIATPYSKLTYNDVITISSKS